MSFKIVLVEDDIDLNETIKENFYTIESVFDGEEVLNRILKKNYDLVILDIKVPKVDGFCVSKEKYLS